MATIRIDNLQYAYPSTGFALAVDHLEIALGEKVAVVGPSGSGKSTMLKLIAGVLQPRAGAIEVCGMKWLTMSEIDRRAHRAGKIGYVLQDYDLLEYLTVIENILLPFIVGRSPTPRLLKRWQSSGQSNNATFSTATARQHAEELASRCGLAQRMHRWPSQLSHGERQRVAVCRGLITQPELILADEPTGSLDRTTSLEVLDLLLEHVSHTQATLLMVTHDHALLDRFDRVLSAEQWQ